MHFLVGLAGVAIWKYMSACFITHVACSHQHCRRKSRERTFTGQGTAGLTRDHLQRDTRKDMTAVLRTVNEINSAQPVDVLHISSFTVSSINSMTYHDILDLHHMYILSIMNVSQIFLQTNVGSGREGFFNVSLQVSRWSKVWSKHWKSPRSGLLRRFAELFETMSWLSEGFHYDYNYVCDLYTLFFLFMLHFWIETCRFSFGICFSWCGETSGLFGDWTDRIHLSLSFLVTDPSFVTKHAVSNVTGGAIGGSRRKSPVICWGWGHLELDWFTIMNHINTSCKMLKPKMHAHIFSRSIQVRHEWCFMMSDSMVAKTCTTELEDSMIMTSLCHNWYWWGHCWCCSCIPCHDCFRPWCNFSLSFAPFTSLHSSSFRILVLESSHVLGTLAVSAEAQLLSPHSLHLLGVRFLNALKAGG